jgi:hypothetical protein
MLLGVIGGVVFGADIASAYWGVLGV